MGGLRLTWCTDEVAKQMADRYNAKISLKDIIAEFHLTVTPQCLYQVLCRRKLISPHDGHRLDALGRIHRAGRRRLTKDEVEAAYDKYQTGTGLSSLAAEYGVQNKTLLIHFSRLRDERYAMAKLHPKPIPHPVYEPSSFIRPPSKQRLMAGR